MKRILRTVLLILIPILLITAATAGAVYMGFLTPPKFISNNSLVKKLSSQQAQTRQVKVEKDIYLAQIESLQKDVDAKNKEIDELSKQNDKLQQQIAKLEIDNKALQGIAESAVASAKTEISSSEKYKVMANYYSAMKDSEAASIMNQLDDDSVIGILQNMESETAAKILAEMDPKRAAVLTKKMLE